MPKKECISLSPKELDLAWWAIRAMAEETKMDKMSYRYKRLKKLEKKFR